MKLLALFVMVLCLTSGAALAAAAPSDAQILHLLNRISFGPTPEAIEAVRHMGIDNYVFQQLHPDKILPYSGLEDRLRQLPTTTESLTDIAAQYQPRSDGAKLSPDERRMLNKDLGEIVLELSQAKILRAILSPAQLQEVMSDFWFNHFNVYAEKNEDRFMIATYDRDAIRPYALGKFRDLLGAVAHHPAMLIYLDNWQNTDPDSIVGRRAAQRNQTLGINENYAREIMELHTLGVDGGYTQTDVTVLAHILTGWGIGRGKNWADRSIFAFDPQRHDYYNQIFLGQEVRGGGEDEVEHVLDVLAASPATAHHIAYELAQNFVADQPPNTLVDRLAQTYTVKDGDIAEVLRVLFQSPEFWDAHHVQNKFKPPLRFIVSSLRALGGAPYGDTRLLQGAIAQMGEPLYRCTTPNGYSNTNDQWLSSDSLYKRINDAKSLSRFFGPNGGENVWQALGQTWSPTTYEAVKDANAQIKPAMLLASPEFLYY